MDEPRWRDAGPDAQVERPWPERTVGPVVVRLVRLDEQTIAAIAPSCPHMGAPLTSAVVADGRIECPRHWYAFAPSSGACLVPERDDVRLATWPTRIVAGRVQVLA